MKEEIQYGYCHCGCGGKTPICKQNETKRGFVKGEPHRYLVGHATKGKTGEKCFFWQGGVVIQLGYRMVKVPDHPRANSAGYVREHILIAERALGKPLPEGAIVHHANGTRDSGPLIICQDDTYHKLLHVRLRAFRACSDPNKRKCCFCKRYDDIGNLFPFSSSSFYHRDCYNNYARENYPRRRKTLNANQCRKYAKKKSLGVKR